MRMTGMVPLAAFLLASAAGAETAQPAVREVPPPPIGADSAGMFFVSYPRASLRLNEHGSVHYQVNVDRNGRPADCLVTRSSGFERLDEITCAAVVHHARFVPWRNENGMPVPSRYEGRVDWIIR